MKYYTITVNGNTYEVSVEENKSPKHTSVVAPAPVPASPIEKPTTAPTQETNPSEVVKPVAAPASTTAGNIRVVAPMPGKIISIKVEIGQSVKKGEVIIILEAMKMENEIVATHDGTIATIDITPGQSVQAGTLLVTLN